MREYGLYDKSNSKNVKVLITCKKLILSPPRELIEINHYPIFSRSIPNQACVKNGANSPSMVSFFARHHIILIEYLKK
jgi:hypothetical protein